MQKTLDLPWLFVNKEMLKYADTLAHSKLKNDRYDLAKAIYEITSSRFESPKHSVRFFRVYAPEPAYKTWDRAGKVGSLKQSIVLKSMLLATGMFTNNEVKVMRSQPPYISPAARGHYFIRVNPGKGKLSLDPWGRNWKVPFGEYYGTGKSEYKMIPRVFGEWDVRISRGGCSLYLKK